MLSYVNIISSTAGYQYKGGFLNQGFMDVIKPATRMTRNLVMLNPTWSEIF